MREHLNSITGVLSDTLKVARSTVLRVLLIVFVSITLSACSDKTSDETSDETSNPDASTESTSSPTNSGSFNGSIPDTANGSTANPNDDQPGDGGASGDSPNTGAPENVDEGETDSANDSAGAADPDTEPQSQGSTTASPIGLTLQTVEDSPVRGLFSVDTDTKPAEVQSEHFVITEPPSHGAVVHIPGAAPFTYLPNPDFFGSDKFVYAIGNGASATVNVTVISVNDAPALSDDVQRVVDQGDSYTHVLKVRDADDDMFTFSANNLPSWLNLDSVTGVLLGMPTEDDVGVYESIEFRVTDPNGLSDTLLGIQIEVVDVNDPPTLNLSQFPSNMDAGDAIAVNVFPDDPDNDPVEISVEPNENLQIQVDGSLISIVVNEVVQVARVDLEVVARDALGDVTREIVPITLHPLTSSGLGRTLKGRSVGEGIHLVVLGDGYQVDQQKQYRQDVLQMMALMMRDPSIAAHFDAWNVHMVETPSVDSGIDDNVLRDNRDTVYNTGYFCKEVRRLICGDQLAMYDVAITEYPDFDAIVILVNDSRYGGGGGNVAIASTSSPEIALHELGHSFAGLADEYIDRYLPQNSLPNYVEGLFANISVNNDPAQVPWRHWFTSTDLTTNSDQEVGVFEGAFYRPAGYFRPTQDSLMRSYDGQLGPVNGEEWALRVYARINSVLDVTPRTPLVLASINVPTTFTVEPLFNENIRSIEWRLNGALLVGANDQLSAVLTLAAGTHNVEVTVKDNTGRIRKPEPHSGVVKRSWTLVVR